jgi:transcriptional regulator
VKAAADRSRGATTARKAPARKARRVVPAVWLSNTSAKLRQTSGEGKALILGANRLPLDGREIGPIFSLPPRGEEMSPKSRERDVVQGTMDMLILKALSLAPMHGWGITQRIGQITRNVLQVNPGSLYPALERLQDRGWIRADWDTTENSRRAKYYRLTAAGRKKLGEETESWRKMVAAVEAVLRTT